MKNMKKFAFLFIICILFGSCNNRWEVIENTSVMISEIEYKGHTYIEFKDNSTYGANILHSPDCKCHNDTIK